MECFKQLLKNLPIEINEDIENDFKFSEETLHKLNALDKKECESICSMVAWGYTPSVNFEEFVLDKLSRILAPQHENKYNRSVDIKARWNDGLPISFSEAVEAKIVMVSKQILTKYSKDGVNGIYLKVLQVRAGAKVTFTKRDWETFTEEIGH